MKNIYKKCPFCGNKEPGTFHFEETTKTFPETIITIVCIRCGAQGPKVKHLNEGKANTFLADRGTVVKLWNQRK
jgi:hypothetical protein